MLVIPGGVSRDLCDGLTRRDLLRVGGSTILGVSLAELLQWQAASAAVTPRAPLALEQMPGWNRAKSVILVFLQGGPSHLDLWDPKEDAPDNIRSVFRSISTSASGVRVTELLPRLAAVMDRATLVRSMSYTPAGGLNHTAGIYQLLTGHAADRASTEEPTKSGDDPHVGSQIARLKPTDDAPPFVMMPGPINVADAVGINPAAGHLGPRFEPLSYFPLDGMNWGGASLDSLAREADRRVELGDFSSYYQQALSLLVSGAARSAFDLAQEPADTLDRYGRNPFGQSCLLARRLIEAGTRFVEVNWPKVAGSERHSFDAHVGLSKRMRDQAGPMLDAGLATLIADLDERGLLDETLVVAVGEFGRSPRRGVSTSGLGNSDDGRDHWPYCYTALLAGAGVQRGGLIGASDATGSIPVDRPVHPTELLATIYHAVGIRPDARVPDRRQQMRRLVDAQPVVELFGS
ncbi:MAG: DUF1501 domain-containing protein [Planctomycetes bacterium]|nr:DUF1501 domain-containing protein [Planctomycetota bacterium]